MIKKNSSLYAFYDNDKYIVLKIETIDNGDYEEDNVDGLHVLNGNDIEFIDDKDKIKRYITEVYVIEFDLFGSYKKEENNNIDYPEELDGDPPF